MHDRKREILTDVQKKQMDQKIAVYKGLCGECTELRRRCDFSDGAEKKVEKLLMVNPEFYTMWNYKKETLLHRVEHDRPLVLGSGCVEGVGATREMVTWKWVERELAFNAQVIEKRDIKSYCTWHHRKWLLEKIGDAAVLSQQLRTEKALAEQLLDAEDRNFHCWGYRAWVVAQLRNLGLYTDGDEMAHARKRIEANFSNYSAYHARAKILGALPKEAGAARVEKVKEEVELVKNAFYTEPTDQSGWMYATWLANLTGSAEPVSAVLEAARELHDDDPTLKWPLLASTLDPKCNKTELLEQLCAQDKNRAGYYRDAMGGCVGNYA
ncbi:Geranylgeranyl transferase type-2 subunit alpha [Diplonema papillatum]|nr:Geranylgeranyl transferase type-2 subunit alpha [Diplonema papillatum]